MFADIVLSLIEIALVFSVFDPNKATNEASANENKAIIVLVSLVLVFVNFND